MRIHTDFSGSSNICKILAIKAQNPPIEAIKHFDKYKYLQNKSKNANLNSIKTKTDSKNKNPVAQLMFQLLCTKIKRIPLKKTHVSFIKKKI